MKLTIAAIATLLLLGACSGNKNEYDASGNFEADEVIVSAQQNGELLLFSVKDGDQIREGAVVGQIDVTIPRLQKEQAEASIATLQEKTGSTSEQTELTRRQLAVQEVQLAQMKREVARTKNLVKADAATQKQLDDLVSQTEQLQRQIAVTRQQIALNNSNTETKNRGILSEKKPLEKTAEQYQAQIDKGQIINPITGIVLAKYALKGEMAAVGKPLYKIGNLDTMTLRAYVTGTQLGQIKNGQQVTIRIDQGKNNYRNYAGRIIWISDKSEFTPKTIQTKDERANLVYAMKVSVANDGYLKIGMYGEVLFN